MYKRINQFDTFFDKYLSNKYSKTYIYDVDKTDEDTLCDVYVTTNYRVLVENDWLKDLQYQCEPTEYHEKRTSVRFICDRGVTHEFVRHKILCVA